MTSLKGVGKTTLAMHLARVIADERENVVVIDADNEMSALRWRAQASDLSPRGCRSGWWPPSVTRS
ncbi:nucleotide-binding protein [Deinococcus wulumuqiensis]|uniref:nucleotide-binding protein n=1 Tax=Deinococcus wulumuqiensis TaxID=980427 RepID=UPI001CEF91F2|nr:hypothetical protein [Deinococcus wulumuqiensis]